MTKVILLEELRDFTKETTADLIMATAKQQDDAKQKHRAADVYLMRLPDSQAAKKKVPYILHQIITGADKQPTGERDISTTMVRSIFCVYAEDEQEGGLLLLNLMERVRIGLLRKVVIGNQFTLDKEAGLESLVYPDDMAPYFAGEMVSTWKLPTVEREVQL